MDKSMQFKEYREKYSDFYFNNYSIKENEQEIHIEFEFEIKNLAKFTPNLKILNSLILNYFVSPLVQD